MNKRLFNSIMRDAKESDSKVTIIFDAIASCGGYSSRSISTTLKARSVYELEDYIQFEIKKANFCDVVDRSGVVYVEYNLVKMIIVED